MDGVELKTYPWWSAWEHGGVAPGKDIMHGTTDDDGEPFITDGLAALATPAERDTYWTARCEPENHLMRNKNPPPIKKVNLGDFIFQDTFFPGDVTFSALNQVRGRPWLQAAGRGAGGAAPAVPRRQLHAVAVAEL